MNILPSVVRMSVTAAFLTVVAATFMFAPVVAQAETGLTCTQLINLLISIGVIPADKANAAQAVCANRSTTPTTATPFADIKVGNFPEDLKDGSGQFYDTTVYAGAGDQFTLKWASRNVGACAVYSSLYDFYRYGKSGEIRLTVPTRTVTYSIECTNVGGGAVVASDRITISLDTLQGTQSEVRTGAQQEATTFSPLRITYPNAGESIRAGDSFTVTWTGGLPTWLLYITLIVQSAGDEIPFKQNEPNDGAESLRITGDTLPGQYYLQIACTETTDLTPCLGDAGAVDLSDLPITVTGDSVNPTLRVISPNGGETFTTSLMSVSWVSTDLPGSAILDTVKLRAVSDGVYYSLGGNVSNDGSQTFTIPTEVPDGSYTVEIKSTNGTLVLTDVSDASFVIDRVAGDNPPITTEPTGALRVAITGTGTYADAGGTLSVPATTNPYTGTLLTVSWSAQNVNACEVKNISGQFFGGNGLSGTKSFAPKQSTTLQLNCFDDPDTNVVTLTRTVSIVIAGIIQPSPTVTILSPNGGEVITGDTIATTWTTTNVPSAAVFTAARLRSGTTGGEYHLSSSVINDGQEVFTLLSSVPNGTYTFELKTYIGDQLVMDGSNQAFTIQRTPTNIAPAGTLSVSITGAAASASNGGTLSVPATTNPYTGTLLTVSWSAQNVNACEVKNISGQFFGGNGLSGTKSFAPKQSTTLQLNCFDDPDTNVVTLTRTVSIVISDTTPSATFTVSGYGQSVSSGSISVAAGTSVTVSWNAVNVARCELTGMPVIVRLLAETIHYTVNETRTATLTCYDSSNNAVITRAVTIVVTSTTLKGDVNGDGRVTVSDASRVFAALTGGSALTTAERAVADVNNDGKIDQWDAEGILAYAVGLSFTNVSGIQRSYGDLNGDSKVTASDALYVYYFLAHGQPLLTPSQVKAADVNNSGTITEADVDLILKAAVGSVTLPVVSQVQAPQSGAQTASIMERVRDVAGTIVYSFGHWYEGYVMPISADGQTTAGESFAASVSGILDDYAYLIGNWYKGYSMSF